MGKKKKVVVTQSQKIVYGGIGIVLLLLLGSVIFHPPSYVQTGSQWEDVVLFDFVNRTLTLEGEKLPFVKGVYQNAKGDHTSRIVRTTLSPDQTHAAAIITDEEGGSGTFYYILGASLINGKEIYSSAVFLEDRIQITHLSIANPDKYNNGVITVTYLTRPANAPLSDKPSVKVTRAFAFTDSGQLIEVKQ